MEGLEEEKTVQCLTTKEIKALAKPEFAANPEKFYPVTTFAKMGYKRYYCEKGECHYWSSVPRDSCGDSNIDGKYDFIGNGILKDGKKTTFAECWK